jgi:hypothetical protein
MKVRLSNFMDFRLNIQSPTSNLYPKWGTAEGRGEL